MPTSNKRKHVPQYNKSCRVIKHTVYWWGPLQLPLSIFPSLPASLSVLESLPTVVLLCCCMVTSLRDIKPIIRTLAYKDKRVRQDFLSFKTETKMTGNAHSFPRRFIQYCHPWPVWLYRIFPHYLTNGTNFVLMSQNIKCVFWFSLELSSETFLIIGIIQRLTIHLHRSSCKVPVILVGFLIKLEISQQVFEKSSNIKFHENRSCGSRVDPCGQTRRN